MKDLETLPMITPDMENFVCWTGVLRLIAVSPKDIYHLVPVVDM